MCILNMLKAKEKSFEVLLKYLVHNNCSFNRCIFLHLHKTVKWPRIKILKIFLLFIVITTTHKQSHIQDEGVNLITKDIKYKFCRWAQMWALKWGRLNSAGKKIWENPQSRRGWKAWSTKVNKFCYKFQLNICVLTLHTLYFEGITKVVECEWSTPLSTYYCGTNKTEMKHQHHIKSWVKIQNRL